VIGELNHATGQPTFQKRYQASKHFLRKPAAICYDVTVLRRAESLGAVIALVIDIDSGRQYTAQIATIWQHGFKFNRGFGEQIALPLERWAVDGQSPRVEGPKVKESAQMALFEVPVKAAKEYSR
jgi:hypothetical protein